MLVILLRGCQIIFSVAKGTLTRHCCSVTLVEYLIRPFLQARIAHYDVFASSVFAILNSDF